MNGKSHLATREQWAMRQRNKASCKLQVLVLFKKEIKCKSLQGSHMTQIRLEGN